MTIDEMLKYNMQSAKDFGWDPTWFGLDMNDYSQILLDKIYQFQQEHDLQADGLLGPVTFRRLWTWVERNQDEEKPFIIAKESSSIVYRGEHFPIFWSKVVHWTEKKGLSCKSKKIKNRKPKFFVNYWDVCLSSRSCASVLSKRGLGVHFCIDNDGTIFQLCDIEDLCYHAGGFNTWSIGVEISNAYYPKYQDHYKRRGYGERPIMENQKVHGSRLKPFLGFYPHQEQALASLWAAVSIACNIPITIPDEKNGLMKNIANPTGFVGHYHVSRKKIDPIGLDFDYIKDMAIKIKNLQLRS